MALGGKRMLKLVVTTVAAVLALIAILLQVQMLLGGRWLSIFNLIFYTLTFVLFVIRKPSLDEETGIRHWFIALLATFLPFAIRTTENPPEILIYISLPLLIAGMTLSTIALATLGRGFGVIAAHRDIKTHGMYRYVRHPLYASEALWFFSFVVLNLAPWYIGLTNFLLFALEIVCQIQRMNTEERLLAKNEAYAEYLNRVPYRLIPGLY